MKRFPWLSIVTCFGSLRKAATATPPSPDFPGSPIPATVTMRPTLIALLIVSRCHPLVKISKNCVTHLSRTDDASSRSLNVLGPIAEIQGLHNRLLDRLSLLIKLKGVRQHHRGRCNRGNGIRNIPTGNVGSASVYWFVQPNLCPDARRRQHADRAGEHGGFVAENVAEHV